MEVCNFVCACYKVNPPNIQNKRDGCMQSFSVRHTLIYPNGKLVIARHNKIRDEIMQPANQAFSPYCVLSKTLIHLGRSISEEEVRHIGRIPETWGDVSTRGLWESQTEAIIAIRLGYSDTGSWMPVIMDKLLEGWEKLNK